MAMPSVGDHQLVVYELGRGNAPSDLAWIAVKWAFDGDEPGALDYRWRNHFVSLETGAEGWGEWASTGGALYFVDWPDRGYECEYQVAAHDPAAGGVVVWSAMVALVSSPISWATNLRVVGEPKGSEALIAWDLYRGFEGTMEANRPNYNHPGQSYDVRYREASSETWTSCPPVPHVPDRFAGYTAMLSGLKTNTEYDVEVSVTGDSDGFPVFPQPSWSLSAAESGVKQYFRFRTGPGAVGSLRLRDVSQTLIEVAWDLSPEEGLTDPITGEPLPEAITGYRVFIAKAEGAVNG